MTTTELIPVLRSNPNFTIEVSVTTDNDILVFTDINLVKTEFKKEICTLSGKNKFEVEDDFNFNPTKADELADQLEGLDFQLQFKIGDQIYTNITLGDISYSEKKLGLDLNKRYAIQLEIDPRWNDLGDEYYVYKDGIMHRHTCNSITFENGHEVDHCERGNKNDIMIFSSLKEAENFADDPKNRGVWKEGSYILFVNYDKIM